ncbi:MAG: LPS export ABC transporter periplasmic protein LptC [Burkholderiales bacterium]
MNNRPLYWFPLVIIAALAGLSMWLQYTIQSHKSNFLIGGPRIVDYMIEDFRVSRTNLAGQIIYTLHAKFAEHFLEDDTARLTMPHLIAWDAQQGTVDIRSKQAFVTSKGKQVNFIQNVVLVRDMHDKQGPLTLTTDYLEAFPDQQMIQTSHPVQIRGKFLQMTAGALKLNNRTQTMQLTHHVKARYEPAH